MFIDLDRFKIINDTLGHNVGDMLLQLVSSRLKETVRHNDTVSRLGGDEFVILLSELEKAQDAALVAQKILQLLSKPFYVLDHELNITASIGISIHPDDGNNVQVLMKNADTAMYHAKEQGKNAYQFFKENMNTVLFEHMLVENNLRRALERNEFLLYYQPKIDTINWKICGIEVLLRWQHSEMGMVSPSQFIPIAEETGLIISIGEWVLRTACMQSSLWHKAGLPMLSVAINLSGKQLKHHGLLEMIETILEETDFDPAFLELELTESVVMQQAEKTIETLHKLKAMGVKISIDDFGTGYSSLNYLKRFPIDKLKIDQSFVLDVTTNEDDAAIVTAIIAIAQSLKLKIVAEGVETVEQLAFLKNMKCNEVQGFYFSRPLSTNDIARLLQENKKYNIPL
jgi:diguanylate cyclase (GGDEF)-like protein